MSNQKEEIERENKEFDRDGFIDEIEMAIDYGFEMSPSRKNRQKKEVKNGMNRSIS
ncbi:MAG: hypothetical protein HFE51_00005 [Clostridia bacterium]|nr:hypothetical protein [Clostridia bacterium]